MKIEIYLGQKDCSAVRYARIWSVPLKIVGKWQQIVVNLRRVVLVIYR